MTKLLLPRGYRNAESLGKRLRDEPERLWNKRGERMALNLFHAMSKRVPAYQDFLRQHKVLASSIKTIDDFKNIPPIDKDNYLKKYPKEMLSWDGEFSHGQWVISTTSGSSGEPYYFPREQTQDWQYAISAELYLRNNFQIHEKSTLYIVAFPMGAWIGGLFTYEALKIVSEHGGYDLSIITPGIHKQEVINAVKQLGKSFDQIIIGAYAPFLKDILDDGQREGIDWSEYDIGFVFSAEAFSEKFRDYVLRITKPDNIYTATLNHYGTVDIGTMAHETPESIAIRRNLADSHLLDVLLPEKVRQPTLCQYNPELFYFEEELSNLLCSSFSGLPLVRYDLKDYGGVISREQAHFRMREAGIDPGKLLKKANIENTTWNLPFVYVYERNDFSVSYYAFILYPDVIRRILQSDEFTPLLTGKFTVLVQYDDNGRQNLIIHIELNKHIASSPELLETTKNAVHDVLVHESSEYRETFHMMGDIIKPIINLWEYENATYFKPGGKQKWVQK